MKPLKGLSAGSLVTIGSLPDMIFSAPEGEHGNALGVGNLRLD